MAIETNSRQLLSRSALLEPEPIHIRDTALAWLNDRGIDLSIGTIEDLYSRIRAELIDADVTAAEYDSELTPF